MTRHSVREDVHVQYRMGDGREAQTIVTENQRDALQRQGALTRDMGSSRLLAGMDRWRGVGPAGSPDQDRVDRLRRPEQ